jgi:hypothetical protein
MTTKTVNYTPEMTAAVIDAYKNGDTVEAIAVATGKSVRSIVAKLSREGVYAAKAKTAGAVKGATKTELVAQIAEKHGVEADALAGLEKVNKDVLLILCS